QDHDVRSWPAARRRHRAARPPDRAANTRPAWPAAAARTPPPMPPHAVRHRVGNAPFPWPLLEPSGPSAPRWTARVRALPAPEAYAPIHTRQYPQTTHAPVPRRDGMTIERPWLAHYPAGGPAEIDVDQYPSIPARLDASTRLYRDRPAFSNMGKCITYGEVETLSNRFAAYLLGELRLKKGDRVAIMMPNCLQYPIATFGVLRAGLTVVNVNPMYTARELKHQMVDSGASVILVLDNFARTVQEVLPETSLQHVITTGLGDMLGFPKGPIVNFVLRYVKKMVPDYDLPSAVRFRDTLALGARHELPEVSIGPEDIAFLQYTGGTTGVAKGAML